jgi:hypothetical protein
MTGESRLEPTHGSALKNRNGHLVFDPNASSILQSLSAKSVGRSRRCPCFWYGCFLWRFGLANGGGVNLTERTDRQKESIGPVEMVLVEGLARAEQTSHKARSWYPLSKSVRQSGKIGNPSALFRVERRVILVSSTRRQDDRVEMVIVRQYLGVVKGRRRAGACHTVVMTLGDSSWAAALAFCFGGHIGSSCVGISVVSFRLVSAVVVSTNGGR